MNVQNNLEIANYNSFAFKSKHVKYNISDVKKAVKTLSGDLDKVDSQKKADAVKVLASNLLAVMQKTEPRTIHFNDAYKIYIKNKKAADNLARGQQIYKNIIGKYLKEIDAAITAGKPQDEIDKLFNVLESFTARYGRYGT